MLISHRKKFIYTKTSKTASTSVESYFEKYCMAKGQWAFQGPREAHVSEAGIIGYRGPRTGEELWFNHMSATNIKTQIGDTIWDEYFKFAVIRNPFDKLVSRFFFKTRANGTEQQLITNFRNWLRNEDVAIDRHVYTIDGQICLDYFIRYENLEKDIEQVCRHLKVPFEPRRVPHMKSGIRDRKISLESFYDDETIRIVKEKFAFELAYFGYSLS